MPRVINYHVEKPPLDAVSIMRPNKYGNPYFLGRDGTRRQVIAKYEKYIRSVFDREEVIADLEGKDLLCCCAPEPCHGDWLLTWANPLM